MSPRVVLVGLVVGALVWGAASLPVDAQEPAPPAAATDVAALFRESCAACHLVPDPAVATDRAWLAQVNETS